MTYLSPFPPGMTPKDLDDYYQDRDDDEQEDDEPLELWELNEE